MRSLLILNSMACLCPNGVEYSSSVQVVITNDEWGGRQECRYRKKTNESKRAMLRDETVMASVCCLCGLLGYAPGYRQFHELLRKLGIWVGVSRLQHLLRSNGFIGYRPYKATDSNHDLTVYPNLLNRAWVSDIMNLPMPNGPSYLQHSWIWVAGEFWSGLSTQR